MMQAMNETRGRNTYVPALRESPAQIVEVEVMRELPTAPISAPMPYANHKDRAVGFSIATGPLAGVVGIVAAIVGVIGWQVPIASLGALLLALAGFAVTWLIAFALHVFVSADGALFLHTIFAWGYLRREQSERFKRYGLNRGGQS
jgi:hypothetical protein